jgi:hypothetical protein
MLALSTVWILTAKLAGTAVLNAFLQCPALRILIATWCPTTHLAQTPANCLFLASGAKAVRGHFVLVALQGIGIRSATSHDLFDDTVSIITGRIDPREWICVTCDRKGKNERASQLPQDLNLNWTYVVIIKST